MSQVCESPIEDDLDFNLFHEDINEYEEQQKILKNVIEEFKKNKENKNPQKLNNSSTIKKPFYYRPNNNRNQIPRNINGQRNQDGSTSEIKVEKQPDGKEKIIHTRYDKNHNVISRKIYYKNNNINNMNYNNNNVNRNNGHHNHNNMNNQAPLYSMPPPFMLNNNANRPFIPNNNNMNNMNNMRLNPNINNFRNNNQINPMNPMFPMNPMLPPMNPMNMNMNGMPMPMPMMNNFGYPLMMMPMGFPNINVNRVDPRILNSLPESKVEDASKLDPDARNCVICLEDIQDNESIICLPCIHVFHSECIKSWLNNHNSCPTCKFELTFENLNAHS